MKKLHAVASAGAIILGVITGVTGSALLSAGSAHADYGWVEDESASICSSLHLQAGGYGDWITSEISMLQLSHDIGRAEAVAGIRQAATGYCPQNLSAVPVR